MKNMKSVLAMVVAVCLMMCLAVPAFATEPDATISSATEGENTLLISTEPTEAGVVAEDSDETIDDEAVIDYDDLMEAGDVTIGAEEEHDHAHEEEAAEEGGAKKVIRIIVTVIQVLTSLALIVVVLMQSGKEAGLSSALSGNSDSYMNKTGSGSLDKKLAKATKWVGLAWILLTLVLFLLSM